GLVHACRYCGLFEEAVAAHHEARRLDPNVPTSYEQTLLMMGDVDRILNVESPPLIAGADDGIRVIALGFAGRLEEARQGVLAMRQAGLRVAAFESWTDYLLAWLERRVPDTLAGMSILEGLKITEDPEAIFQEGWMFCDLGENERGLAALQRAVAKGYFVAPTLAQRPQFDGLRGDPAFQELLAQAEAGRQQALAAFREAGGDRLLGQAPA
ncbi:MAG TPA: hypothetical protein VF310_12860, partial [Vicinamibacteria bacterium]